MIALFGGAGPNSASSYSAQFNSSATTSYSALKPYFRAQQLLYWKAGLGIGQHTLRVTKDSSAANELSIDYATVWTTESLGGIWLGEEATEGEGVPGGSNSTVVNSNS